MMVAPSLTAADAGAFGRRVRAARIRAECATLEVRVMQAPDDAAPGMSTEDAP